MLNPFRPPRTYPQIPDIPLQSPFHGLTKAQLCLPSKIGKERQCFNQALKTLQVITFTCTKINDLHVINNNYIAIFTAFV